MDRRQFLKIGSFGMAAAAVSSAGGLSLFWRGNEAIAATTTLSLEIVEATHEMTDRVQVPVWAYQKTGDVPRVPGMAIFAVEGDDIEIVVTNKLTVDHSFTIPGVVDSGAIAPNASRTLTFRAPSAGTYLYYDSLNEPMNRVMGLHGAMVVLPRIPFTPYTDPNSRIEDLFSDLGTAPHFPGHPWDPARTWIWLVNSVDPDKNALASTNPSMSGSSFENGYVPQYFTLSGKSGFFSSHDHSIGMFGHVGQPGVIRSMNAGLVSHSLHIHGNHVYSLTNSDLSNRANRTVRDNLFMVDVWTLPPLTGKDMLMPFIKPPDIPPAKWPPVQELFPLEYPMHCHTEPSQTAAGANYPSGLLTHFRITGDVSAGDAVIQVAKAELRFRFGKLVVAGKTSQPGGTTLRVRAGSSSDGPVIGTTVVNGDGTWSYAGRALKALVTRRISITTAGGGPQRLDVRPTMR